MGRSLKLGTTATGVIVVVLLPAATSSAQDLTKASLEELMNIEVTSVSKKEQRLSRVAAAAYVLTQEDIRRSGATSIPEALRMVPGLHVAQIDAGKWAVTARGFNGRFANKMLVLIDGRSVYTPLFSGTYWDSQDTLLEDIERIEVIRGPGATMWGANAVNGVINIITKPSAATQGTLITAGGGNQSGGFGSVRHGARMRNHGHYRMYSKYEDHAGSLLPDGSGAGDGWRMLRAGFRTDWELSEREGLTIEGGVFRGAGHEWGSIPRLTSPFSARERLSLEPSGGHILGRWTRRNQGGSETALRFYFDRSDRDEGVVRDRGNTFDFDVQHRLPSHGRHEVLLGAGERVVSDDPSQNFIASFDPARRTDSLFNALIQDEITLAEDRLYLTLGGKIEHNSYTGIEMQPTARLLWTPASSHSFWAAASRAVRTPSRRDHDIQLNVSVLAVRDTLVLLRVLGNRAFRSEVLRAFEFGYRAEPSRRVSIDVATFYNRYNRLATYEAGAAGYELAPEPAHILVPLNMGNQMDGETYGVETAATVHATSRWKWNAGHTFLRMHLRPYATSTDPFSFQDQDSSPRHQVQLRSSLDITPRLSFDAALYRVGAVAIPNRFNPPDRIPAYTRVDTRLGWRATRKFEFSLGGQNLLDNRHPEFCPEALTDGAEIGRSVYLKLTWQF